MTLRSDITMNEVQRSIFQSVFTQTDGQRPTIFRWVIDCGISTVGEALSPDLRITVDKAWCTGGRLPPCQSAISTDTLQGMFPQTDDSSVGQGIPTECLIVFVQRYQRIILIGFLHPLHALCRVSQYLIASLHESLVLGFLIIRVVGVLLVEAVVIVNKVYRTERTVGLNLTNHSTDAVSIVGMILQGKGDAVVSGSDQLITLRHIEAHTLVHHRLDILRHHTGQFFLGRSVGHFIFREELHGSRPRITIGGCHQHRLTRCLMLMTRIGKIMHIKFPMPIGHHRLMVVSPWLGTTHQLDVVYTHNRTQSTVMATRIGYLCTGVMHHIPDIYSCGATLRLLCIRMHSKRRQQTNK